ncbi:hypothetical protein C9374_001253 [Naegleria lovaniensis]|uniref:RGS domain-containing protein n=1 Tax=Naegleria lovaniensis TaxID=51637 RepID=A0AA88GX11_NAELO|nr:uncharacterized protein C9374_001253 [Naegleria lovaniensis]KAG2387659.1 hypothetical protein C9374_001253 [Naegleria lovaniensis]
MSSELPTHLENKNGHPLETIIPSKTPVNTSSSSTAHDSHHGQEASSSLLTVGYGQNHSSFASSSSGFSTQSMDPLLPSSNEGGELNNNNNSSSNTSTRPTTALTAASLYGSSAPLNIPFRDHDDSDSCATSHSGGGGGGGCETDNEESSNRTPYSPQIQSTSLNHHDRTNTKLTGKTTFTSSVTHIELETIHNSNKSNHGDSKSNIMSSATSGKSPSRTQSNTNSKTSGSEHGIRIKTCCGTIELSCLKVVNVFSLLVNLVAFVALGIIIVVSYTGGQAYNAVLDGLDTDTTYYRQMMISSARSTAFCNFTPSVSKNYSIEYNMYYQKFIENINVILKVVPKELQYPAVHNISLADLRTSKAMTVERIALNQSALGNYQSAMNLLDSDNYKYFVDGYDIEFQPLVDFLHALDMERKSFSLLTTTLSLIVICVSIAIVIPVVLSSIGFSLKRDSSNSKKLKQLKATQLSETMKDKKSRELFRAHCASEFSLENFMLLDKITDYKEYSERSFQIQEYLYDNDQSEETASTITSASSSEQQPKRKKKRGFTEKDLMQIEKKKFEIAFEIYSEYLDVHGDKSVNINKQASESVKEQLDYYATGQSEHLPDLLFDSIYNEICILMLDSHHRFIMNQEANKQAKKEQIKKREKARKLKI